MKIVPKINLLNLKGKKITITKCNDDKFEGNHPNGIDKGYSRTGVVENEIEIGKPFIVTYPDRLGHFQTSRVTEILDNQIKTLNSTYNIKVI